MTTDERAAGYIICNKRKARPSISTAICARCPRFDHCPDIRAAYIRAGFAAAQTRAPKPARKGRPRTEPGRARREPEPLPFMVKGTQTKRGNKQ